MEVGEFGKQECMARAAQFVAEGEAIGTFIDGVDTIWIDAANPAAVRKIEVIKGEKRVGRPLSAILPAADIVPFVDPQKIPESLQPIILDPVELASRIGALGLLRLPVRPDLVQDLPPVLRPQTADGTHWLQNWFPDGHEAADGLVQEIKKVGVNLPGATSMNVSGQPEIADQDEAELFSRERGIAYLLREPHPSHEVEGSFPIVGVGPEGVMLIREGHFPGELFEDLLSYKPIDFSQAKADKYPISAVIRERFKDHGLSPHELRTALLELIHGM